MPLFWEQIAATECLSAAAAVRPTSPAPVSSKNASQTARRITRNLPVAKPLQERQQDYPVSSAREIRLTGGRSVDFALLYPGNICYPRSAHQLAGGVTRMKTLILPVVLSVIAA